MTRKLLSAEDFVFDKEKEEQYINLLCQHSIPLGQKISSNCNSLTDAIKEGDFESNSMMNVLAFTLDYLSDVYFLKRSFNRFCRCTDTPLSEVTGDTEIGIAISQIDYFIYQAKSGVKMLDDSLVNLAITRKITLDELTNAKKSIADIQELFEKHDELNWYGREVIQNTENKESCELSDNTNNT